MRIAHDTWLSTVLERPVFAVTIAPDDDRARSVAEVAGHAGGHANGFYFVKLPSTDVAGVAQFAAAGFQVVEARLGFSQPLDSFTRFEDDEDQSISVSPFDASWRDGVLEIAGSSFKYSRFHMDPGIGGTLADRVKREWIRSYVERRRGDCLLVACDRGTPVGFAAMLVQDRQPRSAAVIDLIGVHPGAQRHGIGRRLIAAAAAAYTPRCGTLDVGTQACNIPSVRLYERTGFRLVESSFMLHRHVHGG